MTEKYEKVVVNGNGIEVHPHKSKVSENLLREQSGHLPGVFWLTGLSGSGKSTIAHEVEHSLVKSGYRVFVLDGDTLRSGLCKDLTFGPEARKENLRRAAEVIKLINKSGQIVIASFVSPFIEDRAMVKELVGSNFKEIYIKASVEECEKRDPKGLYKKARNGEIPNFTGISSPYEEPVVADLVLNTIDNSFEDCVKKLDGFIKKVCIEVLEIDYYI